jgi:hypothetical protein
MPMRSTVAALRASALFLLTAATCITPWCCAAAPASASGPGPVGYWMLADGSGAAAKDSVDTDPVSLAADGNEPLEWATGPGVYHAARFNGEDELLESEDAAAKLDLPGAFTIAFWIRPQIWAERASQGIVSKKNSDRDRGYVVYNNRGAPTRMCIRLSGARGSADLTSETDVTPRRWQHWAIVCDPETRTAP